MIRNLETILELAKKQQTKKVAVAWSLGKDLLDALSIAYSLNIIEPILIGPKEKILKSLDQDNHNLEQSQFIESNNEEEAAQIAVGLAKNNQVEIIMKGLLDTNTLLKAVVNREKGIRKSKLLSHVAIISYPKLDRVLFCSDVAMNIEPSVEEKIVIIENMLQVTKSLGYSRPLIGLVSSIEQVNPKIKSSIEARQIVDLLKNYNLEAVIDGPFAIDNLVSLAASHEKNINSPVAGRADGLIFPNLDAGNIFYKSSLFLADATSAGVIVGANVPIVLTSRADSLKSKLYSIALSVVLDDEV